MRETHDALPIMGCFVRIAQILLPDARVFNGGGGLCGDYCPKDGTNHFDGEIFSPPYLFNADGSLATRPAIVAAPGTATLGMQLVVTTDVPVAAFSLIRVGCEPTSPQVLCPTCGIWQLGRQRSDARPHFGTLVAVSLPRSFARQVLRWSIAPQDLDAQHRHRPAAHRADADHHHRHHLPAQRSAHEPGHPAGRPVAAIRGQRRGRAQPRHERICQLTRFVQRRRCIKLSRAERQWHPSGRAC